MKSIVIFMGMVSLAHASVAQSFQGRFMGEQPGISSVAELSVADKQLKGVIVMNGRKATVSGTVNDSLASGWVYDAEMDKSYSFQTILQGNALSFSITFPELNNHVVELLMQRSIPDSNNTVMKYPDAKRDARLVGVWRYTDIISSGSGNNFGSIATDHFMEFKTDGTLLSWSGKTAGGTRDVSISGTGGSKVDKGEWYTEDKKLVLLDPSKNQQVTVVFFAEAHRIMLQSGNNKRVWQRVR